MRFAARWDQQIDILQMKEKDSGLGLSEFMRLEQPKEGNKQISK